MNTVRSLPLSRTLALLAVGGVGIVSTLAFTAPSSADSLPASGCITDCIAVFDTAGDGQTFTVPTGISTLTATVSGAAGAPASFAITNDPTAVGGPGGVTTVQLGATHAGELFTFGVGGVGQGSWLQKADGSPLAIAGGGGAGGYAAYLSLPDQILAVYPGGAGGAPSGPGVAAGNAGMAFGAHTANGGGATAAPGTGGVGQAPGSVGFASAAIPLAVGGGGGSAVVNGVTHTAGAGGGGHAGGGGGAVKRNIDNGDDIFVDLVAPGGGGSGYLDAGFTATAGVPNASRGSVAFTWSFAPVVSTDAGAEIRRGDRISQTISGLPAARAFSIVFDGKTVGSGVSDSVGAAAVSFVLDPAQRAGSFAVQLVADGVVIAETGTVIVVVPPTPTPTPTPTVTPTPTPTPTATSTPVPSPEPTSSARPGSAAGSAPSGNSANESKAPLASTGVDSLWLLPAAALLLAFGALALGIRRRVTARG